jgi:hypothetical protein
VEHASGKLISGRPGVAEGMGPHLMSLPKVAVFSADISFHGLTNDQVAKFFELGIGVALSAELGSDESRAGLLAELEEAEVSDASHLDDLGDTVSNPALVHGLPEATIGQSQDWRVVGTVKVLEAEAIAAGPRRRAGIDTSHDRGAEHDVRGVAVVERGSEATDVSDDTTTHDKDRFIAGNLVVLKLNQDLFHILDILVNLVSAVDQLDQLDVEVREVGLELLTVDGVHLVVNESNAAAERRVNVGENLVGWVKNAVGDLDGRSQSSRHDRLDGLRVGGSEGKTVAVAVDRGRVDGVRVNGSEFLVVLLVLGGLSEDILAFSLDIVFEADGRKFAGILDQIGQCCSVALDLDVKTLVHLLDELEVLTDGKVGEELKCLGDGKKFKVMTESVRKILVEDWKAGQKNEHFADRV